mgnify:CR=1 FL=1
MDYRRHHTIPLFRISLARYQVIPVFLRRTHLTGIPLPIRTLFYEMASFCQSGCNLDDFTREGSFRDPEKLRNSPGLYAEFSRHRSILPSTGYFTPEVKTTLIEPILLTIGILFRLQEATGAGRDRIRHVQQLLCVFCQRIPVIIFRYTYWVLSINGYGKKTGE